MIDPEPGFIAYQGELELFFIQHALSGFLIPLALVYFGRYEVEPSVANILYVSDTQGYASFSWFCRLVQGPLSVLTWTNVNFQLCFPERHPLYVNFGKWYLLIGELSVIPLSFFFIKTINVLGRALQSPSGKSKTS